tara:strand:- start:112656 stop:113231 length:576 start_codon:yes stop_codon:yes gene_type:complete
MQKKFNVLLSSIVIAFSASVTAQAADQTMMHADKADSVHATKAATKSSANAADKEMMNKLAQANMGEVALAELAKTKSTDKEVLKFADTMIEDHGKAQNALADVANKSDVELPKKTDQKHADLLKKMQTMDGAAFDKAYKSQAVKDHGDAQKLLKKIASNAKSADFKALAKELMPTIDQHMEMAKAMQSAK